MPLIGSLTSGVSALNAFSKGMEVIGDNIANVNTTGFKTARVDYADNFGDIMQHAASSPASGNGSDSTNMQVGQGVHVQDIQVNFGQASLTTTGQATDVGITGDGFFRVKDPQSGNDYVTRAGNFRIDDQGYLVTQEGFRVQGLDDGIGQMTATVVNGQLSYSLTSSTPPSTVGDLKVDSGLSTASGTLTNSTGGAFTDAEVDANAPKITGFSIDGSGALTLQLSNGDTLNRGQVLVQNFQDPHALTRVSGNLFSGLQTANPIGGLALSATNNTPGAGGNGQLEQGHLEISNVDLTSEFSNLINTQRSFQAASRVITTADSILEEIVNLKR